MNTKPAKTWTFENTRGPTVDFTIRECFLLDLQLRKRRGSDGEESEYAVLKIGSFDLLDNFLLNPRLSKKAITLMCFEEGIYYHLEPEKRYSFKGFISFGYGNTYLCIKDAKDSLGQDVGKEQVERQAIDAGKQQFAEGEIEYEEQQTN